MNRGLRGSNHSSMINSTQRVGPTAHLGDNAVSVGPLGSVQQTTEEFLGDFRHIARNQQIPFRIGMAERCVQAAQGAAILDLIRQDGKPQMAIFFDRPNNSDRTGRAPDLGGDFLHHRGAVERQQSLVAAHAPARSARQYITRATHEMIIACHTRMVELNKKVYICFLVAIAMLAASPSRAAETTSAISVPAMRHTQVVRADPRTGKLVRSVVVTTKPQFTASFMPTKDSSAELNAIVDKAAKANSVDPLLVHSIIKVESNYNAHAVSNKGAQGLMQLTPGTAKMLGVSDSFDPTQNIEAGVKYLKRLKDQFKGDERLALAAYNAGPGAVDKYKEVPPYAETRNYVDQVGKRYGEARKAADANKPVEAPPMKTEIIVEEKAVEIKPAAVETFFDGNGRLHLKTAQ